MKIKTALSVSNLKTLEELTRWVSQTLSAIIDLVNGRISMVDNMDVFEATVTFTAANAEVKVPHTLTRVPTRYEISSLTAAMSIYTGTTPFTESNIYLKSSATGVATVLIY